MKVRTLLILTSIVSSMLGAVVAYLVLTVPNDIQAGALMKQARTQLTTGDRVKARQSLSRIVQQYPRTDAAAAATVALVTLADQERQKVANDLAATRRDSDALRTQLAALTGRVDAIENAPKPAPVVVQAAPKSAPKKVTHHKKTAKKKRRR